MTTRKCDADQIAAFLRQLAAQPWLGEERSQWPYYLFHITELHNAVSILAENTLYSRVQAQQLGILHQENASPEIIQQTPTDVQSKVRLYFRPRTPTFYHNEGIRPSDGRSAKNAHCPIPIAFIFDAEPILCMSGSQFSDGNLASTSRVQMGSSAEFLVSLPWERIYHDGSIHEAETRDIVFHRHAEVSIPHQLPLTGYLRHIFVRSPAELETLRSLTSSRSPTLLSTFGSMMRVNTRSQLFYKKWTFVERVSVAEGVVRIRFNQSTETPGPFNARIRLMRPDIDIVLLEHSDPVLYAANHMLIELPISCRHERFLLQLFLDDCLAYQNEIDPTADESILSRQ